jgi:hypothetical protein
MFMMQLTRHAMIIRTNQVRGLPDNEGMNTPETGFGPSALRNNTASNTGMSARLPALAAAATGTSEADSCTLNAHSALGSTLLQHPLHSFPLEKRTHPLQELLAPGSRE